ncbi:V-type ATP synthase subunit I [Anaerococcus prevotii]|uniref:Putative V-type sodium ATPase, I subunit n=1 Tax=Anaerococcus prevotii ACS-065-V-Col13 TaxID=879305 RepID=F0GW77_9FIRM|nr:V-type ATP synthase subunit I [Anaerococcus prevotii]EGC82010.1 putative V-type sodium ATPase, I subunit [Anaerococcus prevotii ACS-065-V-Col13]MDU5148950.1 V-type ATP synthase subunit I [Anaerococcus prevotii]
MAIVKMNKFNLLAFKSDRDELLNSLQAFNYVHFNDLERNEDQAYLEEVRNTERLNALDSDMTKVDYVISIIESYMKDRGLDLDNDFSELSLEGVKQRGENFDFGLIYGKIKDLVEKRENALAKRSDYQNKLSALKPWKDIDVDIDKLYDSKRVFVETGTVSSQFYEQIQKALVERNLEKSLVYKVSEADKTNYIVAVSSLDEKDDLIDLIREFGFSRVKINSNKRIVDEIDDLSYNLKENQESIDGIEKEIVDFKKYLKDLYIYKAYILNKRRKEESSEFFLETNLMNVIEGYVPVDKTERFKKDVKDVLGENYILDIKEADKDDSKVPIILKNNKLVDPYEEVVKTYSLPKYNEIDPSGLVAIFYTIFTGFMIGDLGYGALAVIAILLALKFKKFPESTEKTLRLFLRISISACVFGFIFGSVFGGIIDVPFGWIDTAKDINELIVMSLVIGGISLFTALGVKGYMYLRDGKPMDAFYDVGFMYMAVGGAIALALTKSPIAKWVMIIGIVGILLFAGRDAASIGGRLGSGAYDVYGLTGWIGDFVSFLRLMALVLSGGFVAYSVNIIVKMVAGAGIGGIIAGAIIFIVFQLFNMFLSYLSAYVHGLRLIYVEMFNKFYEGGGVKFREMIEDTKFVKILRGGDNE